MCTRELVSACNVCVLSPPWLLHYRVQISDRDRNKGKFVPVCCGNWGPQTTARGKEAVLCVKWVSSIIANGRGFVEHLFVEEESKAAHVCSYYLRGNLYNFPKGILVFDT